MATDNIVLPGTGNKVTTRKVNYSGDADVDLQVNALGILSGSDDAKTVTDVGYTAATAIPVIEIGSGTNVAAQTTVTNSSTSLVSARTGRRGVLIVNNQNVPIYIDPSGGTAATTHFRLDPGASVFVLGTAAITAITSAAYTASGDAKVHTMDFY